MSNYSDFSAAAIAAADPSTSPADLAAIVAAQPSLWVQVARHPLAYPELLNYMAQHGGDDVRQAVWQRSQSGTQVPAPTPAAPTPMPRPQPVAAQVAASQQYPAQAVPAVGPVGAARPVGKRRGKLWVLLVSGVVVIALVLAALFGIPGTGWDGLLRPAAPSFAEGYVPAWTMTSGSLGATKDCAKLGLEAAGIRGQIQTSTVSVILAQCQSGDKKATIWYGVDSKTGHQIWSTVDTAPGLTSCASALVNNLLYCADVDASGQSGVVTVNTDTGQVSTPGSPGNPGGTGNPGGSASTAWAPTTGASTNPTVTTTPSQPTPTDSSTPGPSPFPGSGGNSFTVVLDGNVYISTPGTDCSDTVSRIEPATGQAIWTQKLAPTYPIATDLCSTWTTGHTGIIAAQTGVLLAGFVGANALDVATGKVLYSADGMGFTGQGKVYAVSWELVDHTPGATSFADSTGATWQVTRVDGYIDGQWVQFGSSPYSLPLQYHSDSQAPSLDLMADQSGTVWQSDPVTTNQQPIGGFYDGSTLLVATTGGAVYRLDPATGKTTWNATVPVPSPQPSASGTPNTDGPPLEQQVQPPQIMQVDKNSFLVTIWAADGTAITSLVDVGNGTVRWTIDGAASSSSDGAVIITTADGVTLITPSSTTPPPSPSMAPAASGTPSSSATPLPSVCGPDGKAGWVDLYINYIKTNDIPAQVMTFGNGSYTDPGTNYDLVYVNDDDIPELYVAHPYEAAGQWLLTMDGNTLAVVGYSQSGSWYIERQNLILTSGGHMDEYFDVVSSIVNGQFVTLQAGSYGAINNANVQFDANGHPIYEYYWDGVKVSADVYNKAVAAAFDKSQATELSQGYDGNKMDANGAIAQLNSLRSQCPTVAPSATTTPGVAAASGCLPGITLPAGVDPRTCGPVPTDAIAGTVNTASGYTYVFPTMDTLAAGGVFIDVEMHSDGTLFAFIDNSGWDANPPSGLSCVAFLGTNCSAPRTGPNGDMRQPVIQGGQVVNGLFPGDQENDMNATRTNVDPGEIVGYGGNACLFEADAVTCWSGTTGHGFKLSHSQPLNW